MLFKGLNLGDRFQPQSPLIGQFLPEINLPYTGQQDRYFALSDIQGKMVMINFFATWCGSCRKEHSELIEIASIYKVPIYGIVFRDKDVNVMNFIKNYGNPYEAILSDYVGMIGVELGIASIPETLLVAPDGSIIATHSGAINKKIFAKKFLHHLNAE
jgi:cytochrome c biogenesis protein CcmG/thiol:disulfide interchange protein DsbE